MIKTVLLTRSSEDNIALKEILESKGYNCFTCSLLEYSPIAVDYEILDNYSDIIITSAKAALLVPYTSRPKNAWVVGKRSAEILRAKNYHINYVASSALELRAILPQSSYEAMIYLASNIITIQMPENIRYLNVYQVKYKSTLSTEEIACFVAGLDYIVVYSQNCAKTLISLIMANNLLKYVAKTRFIAISSKVSKIAEGYFNSITSCSNAEEILETLVSYESK